MGILVIGLNHRSAPVEVREQLAFSRDGAALALLLFRKQFPRSEAALISTCNRVEVLVATESDRPTADDVVNFLAQARDLPVRDFRPYLYELADEQAIRHLFHVAGGLDSMVAGEYQIINQLKAAYAQASEQDTTGRLLNRLFHHAFTVGKRVRTETEIGRHKTSIPSIAVDAMQSVFSDLASKRVLVVGAGEMAQLLCQYLHKAQVRHFVVASRTLTNARTLADAFAGQAVPYDEVDEQLTQADIVVTATNCPRPVLTVDRIRQAQKKRQDRLMFIVDLAVPRNVEPEVEQLKQVYLYNVDALGQIAARNQEQRMAQMEACQAILDEEVEAFTRWLAENQARPLIGQLYADAHDLKQIELHRLFAACRELTPAQRQAVEQFAERLVNKMMHPCVHTLRRHGASSPARELSQTLHAVADKERGAMEGK